MTPNDLDAYLQVLDRNHVGAAVIELPDGGKFSVTFEPKIPLMPGSEPTPGGWKSPVHLDNPESLRPDGNEYKGELPE